MKERRRKRGGGGEEEKEETEEERESPNSKNPTQRLSNKGGPGGGVGNECKKRVVPKFRTAERRIRWRVPELTPNTPGPAASAD